MWSIIVYIERNNSAKYKGYKPLWKRSCVVYTVGRQIFCILILRELLTLTRCQISGFLSTAVVCKACWWLFLRGLVCLHLPSHAEGGVWVVKRGCFCVISLLGKWWLLGDRLTCVRFWNVALHSEIISCKRDWCEIFPHFMFVFT